MHARRAVIFFGGAIIAGLALAGWEWEERRSPRPCPKADFTIIGDSNIESWDFGPGCANLGVGGNTSKQMADRFTPRDVAAMSNNLIVWATANDIHFWTGYGTVYLARMVREAKAAHLHVVLTTPLPIIDKTLLPPQGHHAQADVDSALNKLSKQIRDLGRSEGIAVADTHDAMLRPDGTLDRSLYFNQDGTFEHINAAGRRRAWSVISPLLGR